MHPRTVSITLHMSFVSLVIFCPQNLNHFVTWCVPAGKTSKLLHETFCHCIVNEIDECIAKACFLAEVVWYVHKIVRAIETMFVKKCNQHISRELHGNLLHNHSRFPFFSQIHFLIAARDRGSSSCGTS